MNRIVGLIVLSLALTLFSHTEARTNNVFNLKDTLEQDSTSGHGADATLVQDTTQTTKKIWNKICPVMGEEVDPKVQTSTFGDKVIGFCCKSCVRKFNGNPEKYMKKLNEDGTALKEN